MKKNFIFVSAIAMVLGVGAAVGAYQSSTGSVSADGRTIYCKMEHSWWTIDGAAVGVHYWDGTTGGTTWPGVRMNPVEGDPNVWKAEIPEDMPNVIFTRVNPSGDIADWGAKTKDLEVPTDGKNLFTITSSSEVWGDPGCDGEWSEYVEPAPDEPEEDGYYIVGSETDWKFAGATKLGDGDDGNQAKLIRYQAKAAEEIKVRSYFNGVNTWYNWGNAPSENPGANYVFENAGLANVFLRKDNNLFYVDVGGDIGIPAEDGYYLHGSFADSWKYADSLKMINTDQDGNVAYLMSFEAHVDDSIRVSSYYTNRSGFVEWAVVGNGSETTFGAKDGDNFKFSVAGTYDVYAKYEENIFKFYVGEHVDTYNVEMTAVMFNGATKKSTSAQPTQIAYSGSLFEPVQPHIENYVSRGYFVDEACLTPYVPTEFSEAGHLYAKYSKTGYYLISGEGGWSIDTAVEMNEEGINPNNKAEAFVHVTTVGETYSCVYYNVDGSFIGQDGLGEPEKYADFAVYEDSHIKFTAVGVYALYWVRDTNLVYLNPGKIAFFTTFMSETGGVCKADGTTILNDLKTVWLKMADSYSLLSAAEKGEVVAIGFDGGDESSEDLGKQFMARYAYVIRKYGTEQFVDFVFGANVAPQASSLLNLNSGNNLDSTTFISFICVVALASLSSISLFIVVKRRKHN